MIVRFKNLHDAACRNIRSIGKYKPYEKFSERNDLIMKRFYNDLVDGKIDAINHVDDTYFKCYHRSTRPGHLVQLSVGFYKNGELYPTYHVNIDSFEDLLREGYPQGLWETKKYA